MLEGNQRIDGNSDGKTGPTKPEATRTVTYSKTSRSVNRCKCKTKMDHFHGDRQKQRERERERKRERERERVVVVVVVEEETLVNRQYWVCVDASNRITLHNRSFFRKIDMHTPDYLRSQPTNKD